MIRRILIGALFAPLALPAQHASFFLDAGVSRMRFADSLGASALSVTPALRVASSRASLAASATFSRLGEASTSSGLADASVFTTPRRGFSAELQGTAGGSSHGDGTRTGQFLAAARLHMDATAAGLWVGAGAGGTWVDLWRPMVQGDIGAWIARGQATFSGGVSPTVIEDTIRYTDLWLAARRQVEAWELSASLGVRSGSNLPSLPADDKVWGSANASYSLSSRVAIVGSAGTYPVDLTQGYPGGRYMTLGLRLRGSAGAPTPVAAPVLPIRRFDAVRLANGSTRIRIVASAARRVEIAGDFTAWEPRTLRQVNGIWTIDLPIPSGTHEVSIRADGGAWVAPPGLVEVKDEFGGSAGLLHVT